MSKRLDIFFVSAVGQYPIHLVAQLRTSHRIFGRRVASLVDPIP
jgi:hypothetical protein